MQDFSEVYVVDCGKKQATVYTTGKENPREIISQIKNSNHEQKKVFGKTKNVIAMSHNDLLDFPFKEGSIVIAENAHLGVPRTEKSVAQVFEADVLLHFYNCLQQRGVTLRLFPEMQSKKVRYLTGFYHKKDDYKNDYNDPVALYCYISIKPKVFSVLKRPQKTFDLDVLQQDAYKIKEQLNIQLNRARPDYDDDLTAMIKDNKEEISSKLSDTTKEAFGFDNVYKDKYKGNPKGSVNPNKIKMCQIYSIASIIFDSNCNLRLRKNKMIGWGFARRYLISQSAFHMRGGVARSNIYHHGASNYIKDKLCGGDKNKKKKMELYSTLDSRDQEFTFHRNNYSKSCRELFRVLKEVLVK